MDIGQLWNACWRVRKGGSVERGPVYALNMPVHSKTRFYIRAVYYPSFGKRCAKEQYISALCRVPIQYRPLPASTPCSWCFFVPFGHFAFVPQVSRLKHLTIDIGQEVRTQHIGWSGGTTLCWSDPFRTRAPVLSSSPL